MVLHRAATGRTYDWSPKIIMALRNPCHLVHGSPRHVPSQCMTMAAVLMAVTHSTTCGPDLWRAVTCICDIHTVVKPANSVSHNVPALVCGT